MQGGTVVLKDWREEIHNKKLQHNKVKYWKSKLCWFHSCHPDGCPLESNQCSFAHGNDELQILAKT